MLRSCCGFSVLLACSDYTVIGSYGMQFSRENQFQLWLCRIVAPALGKVAQVCDWFSRYIAWLWPVETQNSWLR